MPTGQTAIIIAEAEEIAASLATILAQLKVTLLGTARTHDDALRLIERSAGCQIAFVDLAMVDGLGGEIARIAAAHGIQVIATNGSHLPGGLAGSAVIGKPFSLDVVRLVLEALERARALDRGRDMHD